MPLPPFPVSELIWPAIAILVAGFTISICFTRKPVLSCVVAVLKAGLFLLYFGVFFDGTYTFLDDWTYFRFGELLASQHIGIFNFISNYQYVLSTVETQNLSYFVYNASMINLFGRGYYAPVAANVMLTFLAAGLFMRTARTGLDMSQRLSVGLFVFVALSPSLLAWSTVANLKDILVATATAAVVYAVARMDNGKVLRALLVATAGGLVLIVTRFYVPLMLGLAFGITLMFSRRGRRSPLLWLIAIVALVAVVHVLGHGNLTGSLHKLRANLGDPVTGILRFVLTPIPFHTASGYGFLNIPQSIYWMLLPFEVYGILAVWRKKTMTGRFIVIYFLAMTLLYGSFTSLQGPRHRIQIEGLIVIFQYYGLLALARSRFRLKPRSRAVSHARRTDPGTLGGKGHDSAFPQPERGA